VGDYGRRTLMYRKTYRSSDSFPFGFFRLRYDGSPFKPGHRHQGGRSKIVGWLGKRIRRYIRVARTAADRPVPGKCRVPEWKRGFRDASIPISVGLDRYRHGRSPCASARSPRDNIRCAGHRQHPAGDGTRCRGSDHRNFTRMTLEMFLLCSHTVTPTVELGL